MRPTSTIIVTATLATVFSATAPARDFLVGARENIIVLGDSITADGRYCQIIQDLIDQQFPDRRIRVQSRGASGDTVRRALTRLEDDVVRWRPDWVIINLGVNDENGRFTLDEYLFNYEAMINRIQRDTTARIGIMSPIYYDHDRPRPLMEQYVAALPKLAGKYGCLYLPCYEAFRRIRPALPKGVKYAPDGCHAVPLGYWIFAQTILDSLGFPFDGTEIALAMPVTRLVHVGSPVPDGLVGQTFTVDLPNPLRITITSYQPPAVTVPRAAKRIAIDGNLDDWDLNNPLLLNEPRHQSGGVVSYVRDHYQSKAYVCYDDKGFYFAIAVDTPVVLRTPAARIVECDCVELFIDARSAEQRAAAKSSLYLRGIDNVCQYILYPATREAPDPEQTVGGGDKKMLEGLVCRSSLTNTGYILECQIPAARFPNGALVPGATYGLDFSVNDVDRFENWNDLIQFRWSGSQYSFFSTLEWGVMTLGK